MLGDAGVGRARQRYVSCVLAKTRVLADGALVVVDQTPSHDLALAKAAHYHALVTQGQTLLPELQRQAPVLLSMVLEAATEDVAKEVLGTAPHEVAQRAVAKAWNPKTNTFSTRALLSELDKGAKAVLPGEASAFLRSTAENLVRDELQRAGAGGYAQLVQRLVTVRDGEDLGKAIEAAARTELRKRVGPEIDGAVTFLAGVQDVRARYTGAIEQAKGYLQRSQSAIAALGPAARGSATIDLALGADFKTLKPAEMRARIAGLQGNKAAMAALDRSSVDDLTFRAGAANVATDFAAAGQALGALAGALGQSNPQAARYVAAAGTVASTVSQVASVMAAGAMGPVGWMTIGVSVLQAGGNLSAMFGGGGNAQTQQQVALMKALKDLSRQVEDLRQLVVNQHRQTLDLLLAQDVLARETLAIVQDAQFMPVGGCVFLDNRLHNTDVTTPVELVNAMRATPSGDGALALNAKRCIKFLEDNQAVIGAAGGDPGALWRGFSFTSSALRAALAANPDTEAQRVKEFAQHRALLTRANLIDQAQRRLVGAAAAWQETPVSRIWDLHLRPAATWRAVEEGFALAKQDADASGRDCPAGGQPGVAQDSSLRGPVPTLYAMAAAYGFSGLPCEAARLELLVREPLSPPSALTVMLAASRLADAAEFLELGGSAAVAESQAAMSARDSSALAERRRRGNVWLAQWVPLTLGSLGWSVLQRGDYLVPIASELLQWAEAPLRCKADAQTVPEEDKLCQRLGSKRMAAYVIAAQRLVREVPEFRANVAAWRVRQMLATSNARERADGTLDAAQYAQALARPTPQALQELLPSVELVRLSAAAAKSPTAPDRPQGESAHWYMRLSGQCVRFPESTTLQSNGLVACNGKACTDPAKSALESLKKAKPDPRMTEILDEERLVDEARTQACVLAPFPLAARVADAKPRTDGQTQILMSSSLAYLGQTQYYLALQKQDPVSGMELATYMRPPSVPLWRSWGGRPPTKAAGPAIAPAKQTLAAERKRQ
ncbi:hypothetical protein [Aquincola sp. J276]|uniref:hypothetical protein n=1 Tax=Aquincola sp. J276 TaxID=2898432 RepID=UPI00215086B5|nr:hypothetical protein [Aquincola sp. J276]MCR5868480.1 hypothetical protein [Aquincola sp. J276]